MTEALKVFETCHRVMWNDARAEGRWRSLPFSNFPGSTNIYQGHVGGEVLWHDSCLNEINLRDSQGDEKVGPSDREVYENKFTKSVNGLLLLMPLCRTMELPYALLQTHLQGGVGLWSVEAAHYCPTAAGSPIWSEASGVTHVQKLLCSIATSVHKASIDQKAVPLTESYLAGWFQVDSECGKRICRQMDELATCPAEKRASLYESIVDEIRLLSSKDLAFEEGKPLLDKRYTQLYLNGTDTLPGIINQVDSLFFEKHLRAFLVNLYNQLALRHVTVEEAANLYAKALDNLVCVGQSSLRESLAALKQLKVSLPRFYALEQQLIGLITADTQTLPLNALLAHCLDQFLCEMQTIWSIDQKLQGWVDREQRESPKGVEQVQERFDKVKKGEASVGSLFPVHFDANEVRLAFPELTRQLDEWRSSYKSLISLLEVQDRRLHLGETGRSLWQFLEERKKENRSQAVKQRFPLFFSKTGTEKVDSQTESIHLNLLQSLGDRLQRVREQRAFCESCPSISQLQTAFQALDAKRTPIDLLMLCVDRLAATDDPSFLEQQMAARMHSLFHSWSARPEEELGLLGRYLRGGLGMHPPKRVEWMTRESRSSKNQDAHRVVLGWSRRIVDSDDPLKGFPSNTDEDRQALTLARDRLALARQVIDFVVAYQEPGLDRRRMLAVAEELSNPSKVLKGHGFIRFFDWLLPGKVESKHDAQPFGRHARRFVHFLARQDAAGPDRKALDAKFHEAQFCKRMNEVILSLEPDRYQQPSLDQWINQLEFLRTTVFEAYRDVSADLLCCPSRHLSQLMQTQLLFPADESEREPFLVIEMLHRLEPIHFSKRPLPRVTSFARMAQSGPITPFQIHTTAVECEREVKIIVDSSAEALIPTSMISLIAKQVAEDIPPGDVSGRGVLVPFSF